LGFGTKKNKDPFNKGNYDYRRNSLKDKDNLESKYANLEIELIKTNKKLNNLLQITELENQKLSQSVKNHK